MADERESTACESAIGGYARVVWQRQAMVDETKSINMRSAQPVFRLHAAER
jgi:hypothetical protein